MQADTQVLVELRTRVFLSCMEFNCQFFIAFVSKQTAKLIAILRALPYKDRSTKARAVY